MNKNHLHFITYGDGTYPHIQASLRLAEQARGTNWFNDVHVFNLNLIAELDPSWHRTHKKFISENPRGNGYWIWKPKIIQLMLERIPENDVLIYLDGGSELNPLGEQRFSQYVDLTLNFNLLAFIADDPTYYKLGECTKKQCLDYFQISSADQRILQLDQIEAGCILIRNCETSRTFVREWLAIAEADDYIYLNDYLGNGQLSQFKDHRHDQSIFYMLMLRDKDFGIVIKNEDYFPMLWAQGSHPKHFPIGLMRNISQDSRLSKMNFIDHQIGDPIVFHRHYLMFNSFESEDSCIHLVDSQGQLKQSNYEFSSLQKDEVSQCTGSEEKYTIGIRFKRSVPWLAILRQYLVQVLNIVKKFAKKY